MYVFLLIAMCNSVPLHWSLAELHMQGLYKSPCPYSINYFFSVLTAPLSIDTYTVIDPKHIYIMMKRGRYQIKHLMKVIFKDEF
jgi:hypothetical protein